MSRKLPMCAAVLVCVILMALPLAFHWWPETTSPKEAAPVSKSPAAADETKPAHDHGSPGIGMPRPALVSAVAAGIQVAKELKKSAAVENQSDKPATTGQTSDARSSTQSLPEATASGSIRGAQRLSREARLSRQIDATLRDEYRAFYEEAALDPRVQDSIHAVLLDERLTTQDIYDISRKQNLSYEEHSKLRADVRDERDNAVKSLLSAEQYAEFLKYGRTLTATKLADETIKQLTARKIAYDVDTSEKLVALLKTFPPGRFKSDPMTSHLAKKRLTPQQAAVLEEVLDKSYLRD
ncbi:MAG: hypothetical protein QM760_09550 [Nibricoccus sp.]